MIKLKDLAGRITVVLTAELRELALARLRAQDYGDDAQALRQWFRPEETPDNTVLDAAYSEAECLMVLVIVEAMDDLHTDVGRLEAVTRDADADVRLLSR